MHAQASSIGRLEGLRRDVVRKVRQVGLLRTLGHCAQRLVSRHQLRTDPFDARYGTDTCRIISVGALDIPDDHLAHANRYEAVMPEVFDAILADLAIDHRSHAFVDIGCGKGRALLLAARHPFRRIIGVELSAALCETARSNIDRFPASERRCADLEVQCADGSTYVPPEGASVLYINNPFDGHLMRTLVARLEQALQAGRRSLTVVYQRPVARAVWDGSPAFERVSEHRYHVVYRSR